VKKTRWKKTLICVLFEEMRSFVGVLLLLLALTAFADEKVALRSDSGCEGHLKIMVPLYIEPGPAWDTVAQSVSIVPTTVIINPDNGPANKSDSKYTTYIHKLHLAGVELVGYVHTSWGARPINEVKHDIDLYVSFYPELLGIFFDEASDLAKDITYYTNLYNYTLSKHGYKYVILNPGNVPDQGYVAISTQIVTFESAYKSFANSGNPKYATCANKDKFVAISFEAPAANMQDFVDTAQHKNYYGWAYVTDKKEAVAYDTLASYYTSFAQYVAKN